MITELLRLAEINGLTGQEAFRSRPVQWVIELSYDGELLGISPTTQKSRSSNGKIFPERGKVFEVPRNYHMQATKARADDAGKVTSVCTNQSNWLPDFLAGPLDELFYRGLPPTKVRSYKQKRLLIAKRRQTKALIDDARRALPNNFMVEAISKFMARRLKFSATDLPEMQEKETDAVLTALGKGAHIFAFRVGGALAFDDSTLHDWWRDRVQAARNEVCKLLPEGQDLYLEDRGRLAEYHPQVFGSIPLISYDKAPYESYGLGKQTTPLRVEVSEKAAAALNWLLDEAHDSSFKLLGNDLVAVFWAATETAIIPTGFDELMNASDPLLVRDFFQNIWGPAVQPIDAVKFHAALLAKSGKGRFAVCSWHTETLSKAQERLRNYLRAVSLPTLGWDIQRRQPVLNDGDPVPMAALAEATVHKGKDSSPQPETYTSLFETALFGYELPVKLLAAVLLRQSLEFAKGAGKKDAKQFDDRHRARTAMVRLYFDRKGESMDPMRHDAERDPGYLCGRLLAILDNIHFLAHALEDKSGKRQAGTKSSPATRSYAAASTTPALIYPQLCQLARYHLGKIDSKLAYRLERGNPEKGIEGLAQVCAKLRETATGSFPRMLSLEQQGRFAIGFYYERTRRWPADDASYSAPIADNTDPDTTNLENKE